MKDEYLQLEGDTLTLAESLTLRNPKAYEIDFSKVESLDDIINILMGLNIKYFAHPEDIQPYFMRYLKESDEV